MGGGHGGHVEGKYPGYPTNVWTLTGGWFCRPKYWRRNTAIALAGIFLVSIPIAVKSAELELLARMGGGHGGHVEGKYPCYPTNVWTITGGWFCRPKYWRCNTTIALQRPHYPVRPIPSQKWCKNFPEPDPK